MRLSRNPKTILLGGVAAFAIGFSAPAVAQETSDDGEEGTRRLGSVTVTATRREASIQDVPIAVTALSPEDLDRQGVFDVRGLSDLSSSFSIQSSQVPSQATSIRIRGVGTTGNNIGLESAVGVFLDGVYLSRPGVALGDLVDLEQIEVLRGPQGTLFGRNTSAGALNITTAKPNLERVDGFANFTAGNLEAYNAQAGFSVPLIQDQLGIRVSGAWRTQEGILSSLADNPDGSDIESGNRDRWTIRGQALWEPNDRMSIRIIGDYAEVDEQCCDAVVIFDPAGDAGLFGSLGPVPSTGIPDPTGGVLASGLNTIDDRISNGEQFDNPFEQWGISGQLDYDLGFANMTYIGSYRDFRADSVQESDFTGLDIFSVGGVTGIPGVSDQPSFDDIQTQTHELRFQGTLFEDRLDWLVGGFYAKEDIIEQAALTLGQDFDFSVGAAFGGTLGPAPIFGILTAADPLGNVLNPATAVPGVSPAGSFSFNEFEQNATSWSIFTHNTFSVTDRWDLTVGLRWADEHKDGSFRSLGGSSDACLAALNNQVAGNLAFLGANATAAVGATCFPFSTVPNLPGSGNAGILPTPATFSDDPNEPGVFVEDFEDDELIWTVKTAFQLSDTVNLYAGFTHGFKAGGYNLDSTAAALGNDPRFASEEIDAIEAGVKADLLDGRARVNVALFHQDLSDFQVLEFTGVQFTTFNVGQALSTGVEVEGAIQLTDQLALNTAMTYTNARYPNDCAEPTDIVNARNLCGNSLTNAPEFVGIWGATWEDQFQAFGQEMMYFGNVNVRYSTERRTSTQATEITGGMTTDVPRIFDFQDDYTKLNLRAGFGRADGLWQLEAFVNNVTDEITRSITFNLPLRSIPGVAQSATRGAFIEQPRTYGVTLRTRF